MLLHPTNRRDFGGYRKFGFVLSENNIHCGKDYNVDIGQKVYAVSDGPVLFARMDVSGFGGYAPAVSGGVVWQQIEVDKKIYLVQYGHVKASVSEGQNVKAGEVIGTVHNYYHRKTSLPHLHFCVYRGSSVPAHNWGYVSQDEIVNFIDPYKFFYEGER